MRRTTRLVGTPVGPARLHRIGRAVAGAPTLVLGHGAGGGVEAVDLMQVARSVAGAGCAVVLVEQPWRVAGGRIAPRPATLDLAWLAAVGSLRPRGPLVLGGRSAGARVACRTAGELGAVGVVCLAFPLHPPGRPDRSRAEELRQCPVPTMVVQGERDAFGRPDEVRAAAPAVRVVVAAGADHGLTRGDFGPAVDAVTAFVLGRRE